MVFGSFFMFCVVSAVMILLIATASQSRRYTQQTQTRLCRGCGQSHPSFAAFCRRCGRKL